MKLCGPLTAPAVGMQLGHIPSLDTWVQVLAPLQCQLPAYAYLVKGELGFFLMRENFHTDQAGSKVRFI